MPYDRQHAVLQWGGTLPGSEIWSCSMRMGGPVTGDGGISFPTHSDLAGWLAGYVKDALAAWMLRNTSFVSSACKMTYAKLNAVDQNGHYLDPTTNVYYWPTPVSGAGANPPQYPQQCSWAISLATGLQRGPAHRGRFYSPMPTPLLDNVTGLVSTANALSAATSAAQLVVALGDTPGLDSAFPWKVLVMSKTGATGATHPVTAVEVGRVIDTQVRRRNALVEGYQSAPADQGID